MSGIADVCAAEDVQIIDVEDDRTTLTAPDGHLYRSFPVGRAFLDADAVVQVGVLKTHQLMRLTGGVKLTFGVVPGLAKAHLHVKAQRREDFADMLLDVHLAARPRFTIIDGIVAMEGQGPGSGTPKELGSLFAARDAVALDVALADRTAHERRSIYTVAASARRGLLDLDDPYRLAGDPIEPDASFRPAGRDVQGLLPPQLHRLARNLVTARPRLVDPDACIRCNECAAICGTRAIVMDPLPEYDDSACVRCFACTEVCPTAAIDNVSPVLARLLSRD
jgi:Pyruvate/2-oxoacid:ferredoxin oxidoreductase delta subunit